VLVERDGVTETYSADIVVVSAGAINSAALLLRSANDRHPRGLANGSDVVGRHYMGHINSVLLALSKCPNPTVFQKTLAVNDFYFGSLEWEFPMGHISLTSALDRNCKAHELDNLYVVDGSFFPSSGAVNPARTIMADAIRVGDHLTARLK